MNEKLQTGDYCAVTKDQAIELIKLEGRWSVSFERLYVDEFYDSGFESVNIRCDNIGLILSGVTHGYHKQELSFHDFKQRLINTVKNK